MWNPVQETVEASQQWDCPGRECRIRRQEGMRIGPGKPWRIKRHTLERQERVKNVMCVERQNQWWEGKRTVWQHHQAHSTDYWISFGFKMISCVYILKLCIHHLLYHPVPTVSLIKCPSWIGKNSCHCSQQGNAAMYTASQQEPVGVEEREHSLKLLEPVTVSRC